MSFVGGRETGSGLGRRTAVLLLALAMCSVHVREASSTEVAVSSIAACPAPTGHVSHADVCKGCWLWKLPSHVSMKLLILNVEPYHYTLFVQCYCTIVQYYYITLLLLQFMITNGRDLVNSTTTASCFLWYSTMMMHFSIALNSHNQS